MNKQAQANNFIARPHEQIKTVMYCWSTFIVRVCETLPFYLQCYEKSGADPGISERSYTLL